MAINKKIFSRLPIATGATLPASFATNIRNHITEFTNIGLTQTTDTGQLVPENITSPTVSNTSIVGYIMYKVWDNVYLKCEYVFSNVTSTANNAIYYIKPSVGSATDGAGNLVGNKVEFKNFGIQPGYTSTGYSSVEGALSEPIVSGVITSYIYKSDITFWCAIDVDRRTNAPQPTLSLMINKSCNSKLEANTNYISVYAQENDVANQSTSSWVVVTNKMFSPTKLVLDDLKATCPTILPTTAYFDGSMNLVMKRTYHNIWDGDLNTNYDLLGGYTNYIVNYIEVMIKNGGSKPRKYITFGNLVSGYRPFKIDSGTNPCLLIWDDE